MGDKLVSPRDRGRILARRKPINKYSPFNEVLVIYETLERDILQVSTVTKHVILFQSPSPSGIPGTEREYPCAESRLCISERV